jgi:hypothetical protein
MEEEPEVNEGEYEGADTPVDLVPVASAANEVEASMLVAVLEDNEIPAAIQGGAFGVLGGAGAQSFFVCVQAQLAEPAKRALTHARSEAEKQGVEQAFSEEGRQDLAEDLERNPILDKMDSMAHLDLEVRYERLRPLIADWLTDGTTKVKMAEYLSAAGLSREQADGLVRQVVEEDEHLLEQRRADKSSFGYAMAILGVVFFAAWASYIVLNGNFKSRVFLDNKLYGLAGAGIFMIAIGLGYAYWVRSRKNIQGLANEPESTNSPSKDKPSN